MSPSSHPPSPQLRIVFRVASACPSSLSLSSDLGVKRAHPPVGSEWDRGDNANNQLNHCQCPSGLLAPCQYPQLGRQSASAILSALAVATTRVQGKPAVSRPGCFSESQHTAPGGKGGRSGGPAGSLLCEGEPAKPMCKHQPPCNSKETLPLSSWEPAGSKSHFLAPPLSPPKHPAWLQRAPGPCGQTLMENPGMRVLGLAGTSVTT